MHLLTGPAVAHPPQQLKHQHQQARQTGNAAVARELELSIQNLIEIWGFDAADNEVTLRFRMARGMRRGTMS